MKKFLLSAVALSVMSGAALAGDLPMRSSPPSAPAPVFTRVAFDWSGLYAGASLGWAHSETSAKARSSAPAALFGGFAPFDAKRDAVATGLQMGYNHQIGTFVVGAEVDLSYLADSRVRGSVAGTGAAAGLELSRDSKLDWLGTARLRAGVAADKLFVYGTGGLAFGAPNHRLDVVSPAGITHTVSKDEMRFGWTIGAGMEYALMQNITLRAEYLYYDLRPQDLRATATALGAAGTTLTTRVENNGHLARVGMNYRF